jgi:2-aminoethylphosphonate transport system permease protein
MLVVLLPLILYPTISLLIVSTQQDTSNTGTVSNAYTSVLGDAVFWQAVLVTYRLAFLSTALTALLGLLIALALYFSQLKSAAIFMRSIELIIAFPSFLIAFSLIYLYGSQGAVTIGVDRLLHLQNVSFDFLYGIGGIILAEVTYYVPFMIRPTIAVLELLDGTLLEAASALGASPLRILRRVVVPLTQLGIAAGILLCFLFIQNEFGILLILGTQSVPTVPMSIYSDTTINLDLPRAAVEALFLLVASLCLYGLYRWIMRRAQGRLLANSARSSVGGAFLGRQGAGLLPGLGAMGLVMLLFLLPAIVVFLSAFASNWVGTVLPSAYTLRWFSQIDPASWSALWTSLWVGISVALLSMGLGVLSSLAVTRIEGMVGHTLDFLLTVPNAIPSVVLGLAILLAYHTAPLDLSSSPLIVILAQAALTLPFSYRTIHAALLKLPADYDEAAAGLGASPWRTFWKVTLPLLAPALRAAFAIAFTFSMGELGATLMVYPPGFSTGPIEMIQDIERGFYYQGSALAAVLLLMTFVCLLIVAALRPLALLRQLRRLRRFHAG